MSWPIASSLDWPPTRLCVLYPQAMMNFLKIKPHQVWTDYTCVSKVALRLCSL